MTATVAPGAGRRGVRLVGVDHRHPPLLRAQGIAARAGVAPASTAARTMSGSPPHRVRV